MNKTTVVGVHARPGTCSLNRDQGPGEKLFALIPGLGNYAGLFSIRCLKSPCMMSFNCHTKKNGNKWSKNIGRCFKIIEKHCLKCFPIGIFIAVFSQKKKASDAGLHRSCRITLHRLRENIRKVMPIHLCQTQFGTQTNSNQPEVMNEWKLKKACKIFCASSDSLAMNQFRVKAFFCPCYWNEQTCPLKTHFSTPGKLIL